jgi:hypothetical protein
LRGASVCRGPGVESRRVLGDVGPLWQATIREVDMETKIPIGRKDAALFLRADGTMEAFIPKDSPHGEPAPNVLAARALMWAWENPQMMDAICKNLGEEGRPRLDA